jgi:hypothetical protein
MNSLHPIRERLVGYLAGALLGLASITSADLATAADATRGDVVLGDPPVIQRAGTGDGLVLRGSRPINARRSAPTRSSGSSAAGPTWVVLPWYAAPAPGFDDSFDRSGLSPPGGLIGPYEGY